MPTTVERILRTGLNPAAISVSETRLCELAERGTSVYKEKSELKEVRV